MAASFSLADMVPISTDTQLAPIQSEYFLITCAYVTTCWNCICFVYGVPYFCANVAGMPAKFPPLSTCKPAPCTHKKPFSDAKVNVVIICREY